MNILNRTVVAPLSSAIIAVMLAGIVVVGVDRSGVDVQPGEARLEVRGTVEVSLDGISFVRAEGTQILSHDDRVRVVDGSARLELPNNSMAELRSGSAVAIADGGEAALVLESGDLLVEAPRDTVEVDGGTAFISVVGAAKLRRNASLAAGVYDGNVLLVRDRNRFPVPRYRQAAAAGTGLLPETAEPLVLSRDDEWDRRMLPEVLDLDAQLVALGHSFESSLPAGATVTPEVYAAMVPEVAGQVTAPLLEGRAPAENLIGLVLVGLDKGDFKTRVQRVFGFRSAGASWGLVAADRNLNPVPVLGHLESALAAARSGAGGEVATGVSKSLRGLLGGIQPPSPDAAPGEVAAPGTPAPPAPTPPTNPGTTPAPGGGGQPGGQTGEPGGAPPSTPPDQRLDLPPTGTGLDPILEPIVNPLETLLSGVLDTLLGPLTVSQPAIPPPPPATVAPTAPAPAPTTTTSGGGGLLGGLTGTVGGLLGG